MNNPLVSIIVPVFNVEKYLEKCVQSLIGQTYKNIEIILIDDGSKDKSGLICDSLERQYDNIIVKHQENRGCSFSRNRGYGLARGEYFMFVDSDDSLSAESVEELVQVSVRNDADIVLGTVNRQGQPTLQEISLSCEDIMKFCINQKEYSRKLNLPLFTEYINPGSPWMKLIRKSLFEKVSLLFNENIKTRHEDTLFCMNAYSSANKIVLVDSHCYWYNIGVEGSLTQSFYDKKVEEVLLLMSEMEKLIDTTSLKSDVQLRLKKTFATEIIYECWSEYFTNKKNRLSFRGRKDKLKELLETEKRYSVIDEFKSMERYKHYQLVILNCMKRRMYFALSLISVVWSKIK